jgi:alginate O-acetyltransferase complex protein AlgI
MSVLSLVWVVALVAIPAIYWLMPDRYRSVLLVGVTLAFLCLFQIESALILFAEVGVAWVAYRYFAGNGWATAVMSALQLVPLIFYKTNQQWPIFPAAGMLVPLGLSYFALRGVHYIIEAYKGTLPRHEFVDVLGYMFFLPTIIAGPIHRFHPFMRDQQRRRWNSQMFSEGLERLLYGYLKITFVANLLINEFLLGRFVGGLEMESPGALYLTMMGKGLNGYFQFAGYSDVAIGFARLLGFSVIENFNAPLIRRNIQEFWSAWHISLTSWCRDYIYMPTFSLTRARGVGIVAAMAILGLWHEFTARYLVWGLYNGLGIVAWYQWRNLAGIQLEAILGKHSTIKTVWTVISVLLTIHFVFIGFVFVQQKTLGEALSFLQALVGMR